MKYCNVYLQYFIIYKTADRKSISNGFNVIIVLFRKSKKDKLKTCKEQAQNLKLKIMKKYFTATVIAAAILSASLISCMETGFDIPLYSKNYLLNLLIPSI